MGRLQENFAERSRKIKGYVVEILLIFKRNSWKNFGRIMKIFWKVKKSLKEYQWKSFKNQKEIVNVHRDH